LFAARACETAGERISEEMVRTFRFPRAVHGGPERCIRNVSD
jgi:hypothetical protein